jgi:uncharacterized RmlC-like cupin family protein
MRKVINVGIVVVVAFLATSLLWSQVQGAAQGQAQGRGGAPYKGKSMPPNTPGATFTVIRGGDLQTIVNQAGGDTPARVVTSPAGNYGVFVLTAQPAAARPGVAPNGTYHSDTAEIYYVINGTGTALLGGELENATENDPEGRVVKEVSGPSAGGAIKNYTAVRYTPGTIFIVPPGVPHQATYDVISKTDFLVIRIDPKKTINLK